MNITVKDVAKAAGVSRTTVSNVFNGRAKCTEETRQAVFAAAKELGYKPRVSYEEGLKHTKAYIEKELSKQGS